MDCEVVLAPRTAVRGEKMLRAMVEAAAGAGVRVAFTDRWRAKAPWLMTYGLGHPERRAHNLEHIRRGGRLIGWDLGYWHRDVPVSFSMRLTIDADHPHRMLVPMPARRFDAAGITLREDFDPTGPIILCGLGPKQRRMLGLGVQQWERRTLARLHREMPGRRVLYRPKYAEHPLERCPTSHGPIEDALRGASLLVCAHSNTAVDACIAGVPVECEDGAAFALYENNPMPTRAQRLSFLRRLAWWQWTVPEAAQAWAFIKDRLK